MWIDNDILRDCHKPFSLRVWQPDRPVVVMGSSNDEATEINTAACAQDGVEILRRAGGGGAVVLHAGCVVVGFGTWVKNPYANLHYFELLNGAIVQALQGKWPQLHDLKQRGISDIAWGDKKIAGTSLFRSRGYLLFQASLLVDCQRSILEKYLHHPSKEPDYRGGRGHGEFVTGLSEIIPTLSAKDVVEALERQLEPALRSQLVDEFIDPCPEHIVHVQKRMTS